MKQTLELGELVTLEILFDDWTVQYISLEYDVAERIARHGLKEIRIRTNTQKVICTGENK